MNSSITTIVGGLIEVLARSRHAQMLGRNRESRPGISYQNQSLAAYIMCTNGQLDITDGVFAPYQDSTTSTFEKRAEIDNRSFCRLGSGKRF